VSAPVAPLERGLWGVLATPFTGPQQAVDADSLTREVRHVLAVPATGLVALGVFGEGAVLDTDEQALVVRTVVAASGAAPVVVGLSARSTAVAVEQSRTALAAAGRPLAGLMVQVHSTDPDVVVEHLTAVHETTGTGIVLQDYPEVSGVRVTADQLLAVLARCPFVVAVKAEAPPTAVAIARLTAGTEVPVFGGLGGVGLLDELAAGAAGAMTGFSHPEGLRAALSAWDEGGYPAARERFAPWLPLVNFEAQPGVGLALRKEILHRRGLFADAAVRAPARPLPAALTALVDAHLQGVRGLLPSA
jgi:4-hydroxy-tetrahydrodipicolinate synthase